jgi:hypothetical protein
MDNKKNLKEIIDEGYNWHNGLSTIIVDLCKRIVVLEDEIENLKK